jgi:hypothetical protein
MLPRWRVPIDIDEFLMPSPPSTPRTHAPTLPGLLSAYESYAGVAVHWLVFGSSHHISAPKGLVVENFVWRAADAHEVIKTIVQPSKIAVVGGIMCVCVCVRARVSHRPYCQYVYVCVCVGVGVCEY